MNLISLNKFNYQINSLVNSRVNLIEKLNLQNTYACPQLARANVSVELKRLENFDSSRLLAAMFILTLLSGGKPYVLRFNLFQTFHEKDYDAHVIVDLNKVKSAAFAELFSLNISPFLSRADLSTYALKTTDGVSVSFTVADLSFIRVVETHSIFFKWHDRVNVKFFTTANTLQSAKLLLSSFKVFY